MNIKLALLLILTGSMSIAQLPRLDKSSGTSKMMVNDKPFLILGGELHNSTASDKDALPQVMKEMKALNLNTVLTYAYWEHIEPEEGQYNFELIDAAISAAEKEDLKLIIVWFGSWKSTASSYVPHWVKTNPGRFPRYILKDGSELEMLSAFSEENRNADTRAYVALMKHLKETDSQHTVIMTQVENEPGCFNNLRDYHPNGEKAWNAPMPKKMIEYLKLNKGKLFPELEKAWAAAGYKTKGTWEEILGKGKAEGEYPHYTEELFMAYHYSLYINQIAEAGKKELNIPAFCNGWLYNPRGFYPRGTVNPHVLDAYRAAGTALDFYSPNVYTIDYDKLFTDYTMAGNTLFIPESMLSPAGALYSIGAFNSLGFAPFGIDGDGPKNPDNAQNVGILKEIYRILPQMSELITSNYGTGKMKAVYIQPNKKKQTIALGDYQITASTSNVQGFSPDFGKSLDLRGKNRMGAPPTESSEKTEPAPFGKIPEGLGAALLIEPAKDEFYIVGYGVNFHMEPKEGLVFKHLGILSIDEGEFVEETFVARKRWNGDEQKLSLPSDRLTVLKVRLYHY